MAQQAAFEYLFRYEYGVRDLLQTPVFYLGSAAVWRREAMEQLGGWGIAFHRRGCRHGMPRRRRRLEVALRADSVGR